MQFFAANYVLECDELLETITPEFDTIMCLSTTKWIHLNFGDEGLKRVFRRIYAQLRPGGTFILESQAFCTYRKKKKLTEKIFNNFEKIKLKPEHFSDFLIHEVGFSRCEVQVLPAHHAKGFQRPLQVFTKTPPSSSISASTTPYSFGISPHCYNPNFTPFYGKFTPGYTPRYSQTPAAEQQPSPSPAQLLPTPLYSGPTPPLYYGPTPGGYSANSTPCHSTPGYRSPESQQPPAASESRFTPSAYTPSYTPAHPHLSPGGPPTYSPATPDPPCYSPSAGPGYSPTPGYSPSAGYSPTPSGSQQSPGPLYSPGNATPRYSPREPAYSPSIQGLEVTGNTTPHPGLSPGEEEGREGPRYSWAGGSGGNTPKGDTPQGGNTPKEGDTPSNTPRGGDTPGTPSYTPQGGTPSHATGGGGTPSHAPGGGGTPSHATGGGGTPSHSLGGGGGGTPSQTPGGGGTPSHATGGGTPSHAPGGGCTPARGGSTPSHAPGGGGTPSHATGGGSTPARGGSTPSRLNPAPAVESPDGTPRGDLPKGGEGCDSDVN